MFTRRAFTTHALALGGVGGLPAAARAGVDHQHPNLLRILAPHGAEANLAPVAKSFEAMCGCRTELVVVGVGEVNAVLTLEAMLNDVGVDVALPATFGIPDLVEAEAILPLDALAQQYAPQGLTDAMMYTSGDIFDERLWGYQTDGDVFLMFYNKSFVEDRDLGSRYADQTGTALSTPQTWDELDRQMAFFHDPDAGRYGGCLFRTEDKVAWEWWARFHAKGAWPFSPTMEPQIAGARGIAALEDMIASGAHLVGADLDLFSNWARYQEGDIYANIGWGGTQKSLYAPGSAMRDNMINASLPGGRIGGAVVPLSYFNWGWSYVVAKNSKQPELAYQFCVNAVSQRVGAAAIAQTDGFFDPFRTDQYQDPAIIKAYGTQFLTVHEQAMRASMPDLYLARRGEYFEALSYWLLAALAGDVTAEVALDNVAQSWRATTDRVGLEVQSRRWMALRDTYPADLRKALTDEI
ncbi:extracellular solute-binding protein [Phaeobacter inhibens]|uniref:extracellular solute-binding protein n=1 Tax=Phaeobacter inhibens TaxID=221822 RepID=UPI0021A78367|nr:extracellular solute-binding protein [Phaeobacter inhibens]UWR42508.1 extracellular solute-binding protein [Phaeobacter inhibens]